MSTAIARREAPSPYRPDERKPPQSETKSWAAQPHRSPVASDLLVDSATPPTVVGGQMLVPAVASVVIDDTAVSLDPRRSGIASLERHCSVGELSKLWGFSENTIRRLFKKEPGVIKIAHEETRFKRGYTTIRIPERVAQRVHRRLQGLS